MGIGVVCAEAETAKYAQQLANLRKECRQLRSRLSARQQQQQQQPETNGYNAHAEATAAAAAAASGTPRSRDTSCNSAQYEAVCQPLERLSQALHLPASYPATSQLASERADPWDAYDGLCSGLERATSHAEFVLKEWEQTRGNPKTKP